MTTEQTDTPAEQARNDQGQFTKEPSDPPPGIVAAAEGVTSEAVAATGDPAGAAPNETAHDIAGLIARVTALENDHAILAAAHDLLTAKVHKAFLGKV